MVNGKVVNLWLDMDGTIVNLDEQVVSIYNKEHGTNLDYKDNESYWWLTLDENKNVWEEILNKRGTFLNCNPMDKAIETLDFIFKQFEIDCATIITCPQENDYCKPEKIEWVEKYLPYIDTNAIIFTDDKGSYVDKTGDVVDILVDDNPIYIHDWVENGGIGILIDTPWNRDYPCKYRINHIAHLSHLLNTILWKEI